ncbi:hypothetical protein BK008_00495 [Methanobacterium sp. MZ-A1]|jgi:hypothetical protein|uniref:Uncharacterized protein n=1 Tax=Methanobacterium subterraneum TaxID=59277 RepID=A0A2H4VPR5_9EURY|nr:MULTISPECIES: hypothetical protein [Methanobacterium]AUB56027.1 hypothetical protein BK007_08465 [Methanobacterium subterraneum]AUB56943.1 hypothetical protein BK008_00495 [Methanobacterium sp. MZ-A1]AUB60091.1 hypothetical protein BK009_04980 [Methanobacterium subterraneum]PKL73821.1 MAG: hypothetical protein CVV29_01465 [Methanobacteriales archaeon HGW-Methanobacteriales-2]
MDVGMLTVQYLNGKEESFDISSSEVDQIKVMEDRMVISFNKDPSTRRNRCKVIITSNLSSYEISPCDLEGLISSFK